MKWLNITALLVNCLLAIWLQPPFFGVNLAFSVVLGYMAFGSLANMWLLSVFITAYWLPFNLVVGTGLFSLGLVQFYGLNQWQILREAQFSAAPIVYRLSVLVLYLAVLISTLMALLHLNLTSLGFNNLALIVFILISFGLFLNSLKAKN